MPPPRVLSCIRRFGKVKFRLKKTQLETLRNSYGERNLIGGSIYPGGIM